MKIQSSFIITPGSITLVYGGKPYTMLSSNVSYKLVFGLLKKGKESEAVSYFDIPNAVKNYIKKGIEIRNGSIFYNGEELHGLVIDRILGFMRDGLNSKPLIKFLEKLMLNTEPVIRQQLYAFLENKFIPIDQDGDMLLYKGVNSEYRDRHTNSFDNSVGKRHVFDKRTIDRDPNLTCSNSGFHCGSYNYAKNFAQQDGHLMIAKVNPIHVLSVPNHEMEKIRVSEYLIVGEAENKEHLANKKYTVQKDGMGLVNYHNKRDRFGRFIKRK